MNGEFNPEAVARRKAEDAALLSDPRQWPNPNMINVKTQPWVYERRFGVLVVVEARDRAIRTPPYQVVIKGGDGRLLDVVELYYSVEELVARWSVD